MYMSPAVADIASTDGPERMNSSVVEEHYSDASGVGSEAAQMITSVDDNRNADASGEDIGSSTNEAQSAVNGVSGAGDDTDEKYRQYFISRYPDVCGDPPLDLPPKREFDHRIELIPGAEPVARPAYRESAVHNDELRRQLDELLKVWVHTSKQLYICVAYLVCQEG
jgi:hypothetical protein